MSYLLIKNGNVIADEKILKSDVLIKDNLILDTDFSGEVPKDCKVIDAKDK